MPPSKTRVNLNLSIVALRHGLDKHLAMWFCLRAMDYWGSGCLDLQMAVEGLSLSFRYSESSAYRNLDGVVGIFGEERPLRNINRLQIEIYGVKRLARYSVLQLFR